MELLITIALNTLISSLTCTIMFGIWKCSVGRNDVRYGAGLGYHMLHILVLILLFPFFLILLWIRGGFDHYGFLYVWTRFVKLLMFVFAVVWFVGAVVCCLRYFWKIAEYYYRNRKMIECSVPVQKLAAEIAAQMKIRKRVRIVESYSLLSPELGPSLFPLIRLPAKHYEEETLRNIITHELVHYKSGDKLIREILLLLTCIHWFNPICRRMIIEIKTWDEYHCDSVTCGCQHIRRSSYCETLYEMYELAEHRKSLVTPGFYEEKSDLRRRLEQMKNHGTKNKKNRLLTWAAALTFAMAGIAIALAASEGVAYAYDSLSVSLVSVDGVENENGEENTLEEYTWTPEGTEELNYVNPENIELLALDSFEFVLTNQIYSTSGIWLKEGDKLTVSVGLSPSDVNVKVGIVQPSGTWRYVYSNDNIYHTFDITQNGRHKVFVWNETDTEVKGVGYYKTND